MNLGPSTKNDAVTYRNRIQRIRAPPVREGHNVPPPRKYLRHWLTYLNSGAFAASEERLGVHHP